MNKLLFFCATFFLLFNNATAQITYLGAADAGAPPSDMVISPDNRFAYVLASDNIVTYQRNSANGHLTFLASVSQMLDSTQFYHVVNLSMSPDAKYIYAEGASHGFIFSRDSTSGALTPFQTLNDYYSPVFIPTSNNNIVASKNGKHVYITGRDNLFIYGRDSVSGILNLLDTMQDLNYQPGLLFEVSIALSNDNRLAFITGGHTVSVYSRDSVTGFLTYKNHIYGNNYINQGLTYVYESKVSSDDRFIYTVTNSLGSGALVVLSRDSATDSLTVIQTFFNTIRPQYVNLSSDNKLICISSGMTGWDKIIFFEVDSATGKVRFISSHQDQEKFSYKKCIDMKNRYLYSCSYFDSVYIFRFNLFLDSLVNLCDGDSINLVAWGNFNSYVWSTGSTNSSVTVNDGGNYSLTAEDEDGYFFSDSIEVVLQQPPSLTLGNDTVLYLGQSLFLYAGSNYSHWQWNVTTDTSSSLFLINDTTFFGTDTIILTVTNSYGCTNSDTILVTFSQSPAPYVPEITNEIFFKIFPVPVKSNFSISFNEIFYGNSDLVIRNILGEKMTELKLIKATTEINFKGERGIYFATVSSAKGTSTTKFIVF